MKVSDLKRLVEPLYRAIGSLAAMGRLRLVYTDGKESKVQITIAGVTRDQVRRPEPYGFSSEPLSDGEPLALQLEGRVSSTVVIMVADRRYRLQGLAQGEVAIHDSEGTYVKIKQGGKIELHAPGGVTVDGDLEVSGDVKDSMGTLDELRQVYKIHTHVENGTGGGTTNPPTQQP